MEISFDAGLLESDTTRMRLSDFLRWRVRLVPGEVTQIGMGVAFALTKYHCHGIPYGEFGLEEIYVLSDGRVTLDPRSGGSPGNVLKSEGKGWTRYDDVVQLARLLSHIAQRSELTGNPSYQHIRQVLGIAAESPGPVGSFALALARACPPISLTLVSRSPTGRFAERRSAHVVQRASLPGGRAPLITNWVVFGLLGGAALTSWGLVIGLLLLTQLG